MTKNEEGFSYTYCAREQEEIRRIRQKYEKPQENKLDKLRQLDASVSRKAVAPAITVGVLGALLLGTGMSLVMTALYESLGLSHIGAMCLGIPLGVLGLILVGLAYPIYLRRLSKERSRIAPEIFRLADELMK